MPSRLALAAIASYLAHILEKQIPIPCTAKTFTVWLALAATLLGTSSVFASIINIEFNGVQDGDEPFDGLTATYTGTSVSVGGPGTGTIWNGLPVDATPGDTNSVPSVSASDLEDENGVATTADFACEEVFADDNNFTGGFPFHDFWRGYIGVYDPDIGPSTIVLTGLGSGTADFYFYHGFNPTTGDVNNAPLVLSTSASHAASSDADHVYFFDDVALTGGSVTFLLSYSSGSYSLMNGLTIVTTSSVILPEPSTLTLFGLASLLFSVRARRTR